MSSIKKNYFYNVSYQIMVLITPLVTAPYISRVLGPKGVGMYSYTGSIVSYFLIFAILGTTTYGQREISYRQRDRSKRTKLFWELVIIKGVLTLVCLCVYLVFVCFNGWNSIYLVQIFTILSAATDVSWFFQGVENFKIIAVRDVLFRMINIIFIFVAIHSEDDVVLYVFGLCFLNFLSTLSLWLSLPKIIDKPKVSVIDWKMHLKKSFLLFVPTIAIQIYTVLDKTMIGWFSIDLAENGYYEQAIRIAKMAMMLVTALGTVMLPRIGRCFEKNENGKIAEYMYESYNFVWFLAIPLSLGMIGISDNFIPWFLGNGYEKVSILLNILSILIILIGLSNVTGNQFLIPTQRQNLLSISVAAGAAINLLLNMFLIPKYFSIGAAISTIVAECSVTTFQFFLIRKELNIRKILRLCKNYILAGCVMLIFLIFISRLIEPSIANTIFMIITGAIIYFGMLLVIKDSFFLSNIKQILYDICKVKK